MQLSVLYNNSLEQIRANRLEGRILEEIESICRDNLPDNFCEQLTERQIAIYKTAKEQIAALEEIQSYYPDERKPLLIKGFTAAVLCNKPKYIRRSRDLDLFCSDVIELRNLLLSLGYVEADETPAPHEDSFFRRGSITIEIHKYFPLLSEPRYHRSQFTHKKQTYLPDIKINRIDYQTLLAHSVSVHNEIVSSLHLTDIEMTIFLLCANAYKDLFWQPYKVPKVRLVGLLEICDLMSLPEFNCDKLISIANSMESDHILKYVFAIIENALSVEIPSKLKYKDIPIIKLMNDSYSPYKLGDEHYFATLPFLSFSQIVDTVGYTSCSLTESYDSEKLEVTYYASTNNDVIDYTFCSFISDSKICHEITVNHDISDGDNVCILLDDGVFTHIWIDNWPQNIRVYGEGEYEISIQEHSYSIKMYFDLPVAFPYTAVLAVGHSTTDIKTVTVNPIRIDSLT